MSQPIDINLGRVNRAFRPQDEGKGQPQEGGSGNITITISMDDGKRPSRKQKVSASKNRPKQREYRSGNYSRPIPPKEERESEYIPIPGRNFDLYR